MQQTHLFCCLEESQQKWRNTCVSSVLSPYEYDFHSTLFQLPFCVATGLLFNLPLGRAWASKHGEVLREGDKAWRVQGAACWEGEMATSGWAGRTNSSCTGALGMLRQDGFWHSWDRRMSSQDPGEKSAFLIRKGFDGQHIHSLTWGLVMGCKKKNQPACSQPLQCAGYQKCLLLILTLSSTGRSYVCQGNKFPLCSAPL